MSRPAVRIASGLVDFADGIPAFVSSEGRYRARFAATPDDVEAALRLRYEVFNVEMGEGLAESRLTGMDRDRFDDACHHLVVEDVVDGGVVGTYRMQTFAMAERAQGLYTDQEFDLDPWREDILPDCVELGRACIHARHRHGLVLLLLWQGLGAYANHHGKRRFFGCSSITSQDPAEGARVRAWLEREGMLEAGMMAAARPAYRIDPATPADGFESVRLPRLFRTYLRYGARICSEPALDREFGTIDFLTVLDMRRLDPDRILRQFAEYVRRSA